MSRSLRFFAKGAFAALLAIHAITPAAASRTEKILYSFQGGSDGLEPDGWLTFDSAGNLYGTTLYGGVKGCTNNFGCGVVFKLTPDGVETVVYAFLGGTDGSIRNRGCFWMKPATFTERLMAAADAREKGAGSFSGSRPTARRRRFIRFRTEAMVPAQAVL